jgi:hypothetical protein
MRLNEEIIPDTLIKEVRIRKLNGVLVIPEWHAYEYTSGLGMVTFDPQEEQAKTRRRRAEAIESDREDGGASDTGDSDSSSRDGETPAPVGRKEGGRGGTAPGAEARDSDS